MSPFQVDWEYKGLSWKKKKEKKKNLRIKRAVGVKFFLDIFHHPPAPSEDHRIAFSHN